MLAGTLSRSIAEMSICGAGAGCPGPGVTVVGRATVRGVLTGDVPMTRISGSVVLVSCASASPAAISMATPGGNMRVTRSAALNPFTLLTFRP